MRVPLRIVHVVNPQTLPQIISDDMAELARARSGAMASELGEQATGKARAAVPGLEVHQEVRPSQVAEQLVKAAMDARVLVLGSGQRFDPSRIGLGSVATHVTTHAPCPVIVARTPAEGEATPARAPGVSLSVSTDRRPPRRRWLSRSTRRPGGAAG